MSFVYCCAHRLREIGLGVRADPSYEHQTAKHHESRNFQFLLVRQRETAAISAHPGADQLRDLGFVLKERDGGRTVVKAPAEAAVVEIDYFHGRAVDQKVGEPHVTMDEAEAVRPFAEALEAAVNCFDGVSEQSLLVRRHADTVAPGAPMRPVAETGFKIPGVTLEPSRPAPGRRVGVHPRGRFAEDFKNRSHRSPQARCRFPTRTARRDAAVPRRMGDDLNEFPVDSLDRPRRDHRVVVPQRHQPRQFRRNSVL